MSHPEFNKGAQRAHHVHLKEVSSVFYCISENKRGVEIFQYSPCLVAQIVHNRGHG
jgi:hypothetical protein